jgi:hypothetical protein
LEQNEEKCFTEFPNEAIFSVDEASVLHDNNDQNKLVSVAEASLLRNDDLSSESTSAKSVQSVIPVSPEPEKPNEAI